MHAELTLLALMICCLDLLYLYLNFILNTFHQLADDGIDHDFNQNHLRNLLWYTENVWVIVWWSSSSYLLKELGVFIPYNGLHTGSEWALQTTTRKQRYFGILLDCCSEVSYNLKIHLIHHNEDDMYATRDCKLDGITGAWLRFQGLMHLSGDKKRTDTIDSEVWADCLWWATSRGI